MGIIEIDEEFYYKHLSELKSGDFLQKAIADHKARVPRPRLSSQQ
jgi:hypothetical protein